MRREVIGHSGRGRSRERSDCQGGDAGAGVPVVAVVVGAALPRSERLDEGAEAVTLAEGLGIPLEVRRGVAPAGGVLETGVELHAA